MASQALVRRSTGVVEAVGEFPTPPADLDLERINLDDGLRAALDKPGVTRRKAGGGWETLPPATIVPPALTPAEEEAEAAWRASNDPSLTVAARFLKLREYLAFQKARGRL